MKAEHQVVRQIDDQIRHSVHPCPIVPRGEGRSQGALLGIFPWTAYHGSELRRKQDQAVNCRIVGAIIGNQGDLIIEGACCNPGVGCLDRMSFSLRGERNLGPFATQFPADRQNNVTCQMLGQVELSSLPQSRSSGQRSNSASVMKEIPSNRPVMWGWKATARVSPLNSIDTTSVSTMAAFIAGWRDGYLLDATRAGWRRSPPPIRLRATALQAEIRSRQL